jgi:NAD(P) transhydrogenase subunit alpha
MISIGVPAESLDETRIGLSPETAKKLVKLGAKVRVRSGAGLRSHFSDEEYRAAGAEIVATDTDAVKDADIVLTVRRPTLALVKSMKQGAMLIAILDPYAAAMPSSPRRERWSSTTACASWASSICRARCR